MFCSKCGATINDDGKFCAACGTPVGGLSNTSVKKPTVWESTSVQVHPDAENSVIEEYEWFGWELKSSQTVDRKSSHLEGGLGGSLYSVTESVNYVKLVFRRNKNMPDYEEIKALEEEYRYTFAGEEPKKPSAWWFLLAVIFITTIVVPIGVGIWYFVKMKQYNKDYEAYTKRVEEANLKKYEALKKLEDLRGITCNV